MSPTTAEIGARRWLLAAVAMGSLLRLGLAVRVPLGDDELYYRLWAQHLAWSYPDHPPMIAAVVATSMRLVGDGPLGIRALGLVLTTLVPLAVYAAGRALHGEVAGQRAAWSVLLLPAFAVGGTFAFPDTVLALWWAVGLWCGWRALQRGGVWWVATGAAVGGALLSKLTGLALALGIGGAWLAARPRPRDPWLVAGVGVAMALCAPAVLWNLRHDWLLVQVTLGREPWTGSGTWVQRVALFAGGQLAYYGMLAPVLVAAVVAAARRARDVRWRYLAWTSLPLLAVMSAAALGGRTKPHWPAPAYLAAALALGGLEEAWTGRWGRWVRGAAAVTAALSAGLALAGLSPWGVAAVARGIGDWDRAAGVVARHAAALAGPVMVLADSYQAASHLAYRLEPRLQVIAVERAFLVWQRMDQWTGRHAVAVEEPGGTPLDLPRRCRRLRRLEDVTLGPGRVATVWACEGLRSP
ncbi:MAG: glycosyltransferase family 39 protein [Armatimonadota bacterium]|nr:glycosyltransferase family 39 protein [Armatimonadota bacterium]